MSETPSGRTQQAQPGSEQRSDVEASLQSSAPASVQAGAPQNGRGDVFSEHCASREVLRHVTGRWGMLLLVALTDGTQRFGELRRRVGGISEKMLAQTLVWLEQDGFVQRTAHREAPPHVEYRLTPLGEQVGRRASELSDWIETNLPGIQAAQRRVADEADAAALRA